QAIAAARCSIFSEAPGSWRMLTFRPCFNAFRLARSLPATVVGPVLRAALRLFVKIRPSDDIPVHSFRHLSSSVFRRLWYLVGRLLMRLGHCADRTIVG